MRRKKRRNLEEKNQEVKSVAYTFNPCPARQRSHVLLFMLQMSNKQLLLDFALLATLSIFLWCIKGRPGPTSGSSPSPPTTPAPSGRERKKKTGKVILH